MYTSYKALIDKLEKDGKEVITFVKRDKKLALGILLYRVILVDGRIRPEEVDLFRSIIETQLGITEDELPNFEETAKEMATSNDVFERFVEELRDLPNGQKREIVSMMQDISISDREFHELEVNLVSQIKDLLNDTTGKV